MKFSTPVVTIFTLALALSTNAQSSSSSSNGSSTSSSAAPAATSALSSCVTSCQASSAIGAGCAGAKDLPCICGIKKKTLFQTAVDSCITKSCGANATADITAANNDQNSICLSYASALASPSSSSSPSNAAGSMRPSTLDGVRAVGAGLATVVVGVVLGAAAL